MPLDQQLRDLAGAVGREAVARPLTRAGLARLQELVGQLSEVLSTASAALEGRVQLTGDVWPEVQPDDDEEEEGAMTEQEVLDLIDAMDELGVSRHARSDALARAKKEFGGKPIDRVQAFDWVKSIRTSASHLFTPPAGTPGRPAVAPATPEPDWNAMPPAERLTTFREMHPQPPRRPRP